MDTQPPREGGQALADYMVILMLVAVVMIVVLGTMGDTVRMLFVAVSRALHF